MSLVPRPVLRAIVVLGAAAAMIISLAVGGGSAGASTLTVSPTGSIRITAKGNGHGHGMSQYGAKGAAMAGKSYREILAFYYPHATVSRLHMSWIRVRLSGYGGTTTVAADKGLTASGISHELPTSGVRRYRLVADRHSGLSLQWLKTARGSTWHAYRLHLADGAHFHRTNAATMRLYETGGSSNRYYGALQTFRNASSGTAGGVYTIDRVTLDRYTAGVVPREMPASWERAALAAQAVAARTYGRYGVKHPRGKTYDICDTTDCQVYGGSARYDRQGHLQYTDLTRAASDTSNRVLIYGGHIAFTQFSASNGGWSVDGGQPYMVARRDPYDSSRSGDPYLSYSHTMKVASLARHYGIAKLSKITITRRDGNGTWGGRVRAATLSGTNSKRKPVTVHTDGYGLQAAFGLGTTWFTVTRAK